MAVGPDENADWAGNGSSRSEDRSTEFGTVRVFPGDGRDVDRGTARGGLRYPGRACGSHAPERGGTRSPRLTTDGR